MMADLSQLNSRLVSHMRSLHIRPRRHLTALVVALWGGTAAMVWQEPDSVGSWLSIVLVLFIVSYVLLTVQISWRSPQRWWQVNWRTADNELPVLHRLAIIYLMLPVMIWLLGWFHWWLGVLATVLLVLGLWKAMSGSWRTSLSPATLALLLVVAAAWVMLAPAGGLLDIHNADWLKHRTTLLDLSRYSWPTYLPTYLHYLSADSEPSTPLLRYYLGYFILPGLAGRWFGPTALAWVLPLWTWLGVALVLLLFTRSCSGWRIILAVAILIFFSGMDFLRTVLLEGWGWIGLSVDIDPWPWLELGRYHLEQDEHWGVIVQYSSNMTGLLWVPHHFISAALYTLLLVQLRRQPRFLAVSGVALAASLFWSPFVTIGLLPLTMVLLVENGLRPFLRWQNLCLAPPLAALLALYLTSGSVDFLHGWLWHRYEWGLLAAFLPLFYLTEFLVLAFLLWLLQPQLRREPFFMAALATLLLLPWYYYGHWNDLCMRASLPALFLLCCYGARVIAASHLDIIARRGYHRIAFVSLVIVLGVGAITALVEMVRAANNIGVFQYERAGYTTMLTLPLNLRRQNIASDVPTLLRTLLRNNVDIHRTYVKGKLVIRSHYDVYLQENWLVYKKSACSQDDTGATFFLHLIPVDEKDLPNGRRQYSFDSLDFRFGRYGVESGGNCVAARELPGYDISHIRTGQFTAGGDLVWEGSFSFDE